MFNFARALKNTNTESASTSAPEVKSNAPIINQNHFTQMSPDIMLVIDEAGTILDSNDNLFTALGTSKDHAEMPAFLSLFHEDDRAHIREAIQTTSRQAGQMETPTITFKARLIDTNGDIKWIQWSAAGHGDQTYCTGRDITAVAALKTELKRQTKQLTNAESIGKMGRWQWIIGQDDIEWSDEIYRIWDVSQDEFSPSFATMYARLDEDDQDRMDQTMQRAVINQNDFDVDFSITNKNGDQRFIRCEGRCELDEDGDATSLYGIMQDMTERTTYEHELYEAKESAERAYNAKTQFLANMSHELRTPLNAIIGFSEMIESQMFGEVGNPKYLEYASDIRQSGGHLLDLISDILDMSKIEAGKYDLDLEEVNIASVTNTAIKMIEPRAHEMAVGLDLIQNFDEDLIMIGDRRACLQVMLNILSNAVKFTPERGQVNITCSTNDTHLKLIISDNGMGIPANKLATITNPFEQVSSHYTRDHEGSGLGLAITKELIEMHGGTLNIQSQIDHGTDVTITMPLKPHN